LALGLDTQKIQKAGLIEQVGKRSPNNSIVHKSVAALVREGNPKQINGQTWQRDGVRH